MGLKFLTQVSVNFVEEGDEAVSFYEKLYASKHVRKEDIERYFEGSVVQTKESVKGY